MMRIASAFFSSLFTFHFSHQNILGLEGQEYVSLLQWVEQTYPGKLTYTLSLTLIP